MVDAPDQMREEPDLEIVRSPIDESEPPAPESRRAWWIGALGLVVAVVIATYFCWGSRPAAPPTSTATAPATAPADTPRPIQPLGADAAPIDVPPLDQTDALVRTLLTALTSHPKVAAWLATDRLIRTFTVAVVNVGDGMTPAKHLPSLRPSSPFHIVTRGSDTLIDPRSYERYDSLAAAAQSIDPAGAARLYATLKPRIEEAYRDLGHPDMSFDSALERAIVPLLDTPIVDGSLRIKARGGTGYGFADPDLEGLTAAQKQLLRTGPANVKTIQTSLRALALALGIPESRVPAQRTLRERR